MVITHTIPKKRRRPPDGCNKPDITQEIVFEVSLLFFPFFFFLVFFFFFEKKNKSQINTPSPHTHNLTLAHSKIHMSVNRCIRERSEAAVHLMTFMVHRSSLFVSCVSLRGIRSTSPLQIQMGGTQKAHFCEGAVFTKRVHSSCLSFFSHTICHKVVQSLAGNGFALQKYENLQVDFSL